MATYIYVNTGSYSGLLPDDTKPLPESVLTYMYIQKYSVAFISGQFYKKSS